MTDDLRLQKDLERRKSNPQPAIRNPQSFWRSLEELSGSEKFQKSLHREFPPNASEFGNFNRRNFLKILGATVALAGLPACTKQPLQKLVPYVHQPEELVPGKPMHFATAMTLGGFATGLIAESHEGHPTKLEGNPGHPASLGATNVFHQAAILDLYDPDRSQAVLENGDPATWEEFVGAIHDAWQSQQSKNGGGLRILTETVTSPTLHFQIQQLLKKFPQAKWHQYEPVNRDNIREGAKLAFGESVESHYHFDKAKIILSLDSDFLYSHPNAVRYANDFSEKRRAKFPQTEMNRLYAIESTPTLTGANADHRLPVSSAEIENLAFALAEKLGAISKPESGNSKHQNWISVVADDLSQHRGAGIVIVGENQPARVHALAHLLNHSLGNSGRTVTFTESAQANWANQTESLRELVNDLRQNSVDVLVMLGGNPVFTAPADFQFAKNLRKAKFTVHQALHVNETSKICDWHIPENHFLESWSDARAFDGTTSIVQPLILPLYAGKSAHEILDAMLSPPGRDDYEIVREFWKSQNSGDGFEGSWHRALHDGLIESTSLPEKKVSLKQFPTDPEKQNSKSGIEITFRSDPTIYDGRFMNNGWLQELPKPINKLTWDNAALVSPSLAKRENLSNGDVVEIESENRKLEIAIWVTPGQAENSVALPFGYGRKSIGRVGVRAGFNVYELRTSSSPWIGNGAKLKKTGKTYQLVTTQIHHVIDSDERQIIREGTFDHFQKEPDFVAKDSASPVESDTLFEPKEFPYNGYKWGMVIDLSACIGCNACTIACQAENNIPVIGKEQVAAGRIMHWIRVDNYFRGPPENPQTTFQPVPCMHCENAPCEVVCPVGATMHDSEGLNVQVYNRCIGTRYCSNNCPYKVRRFNFLQYAQYDVASYRPMWNPDVTVRWRGVMEKCTYCLQRISEARITAENQNRRIRAGEFQTACQQVCPTSAIVFGDLNATDSRVAKLKTHELNYLMLGQLNTRPRTSYLAKLRNPNPKLSS
ncbi:MAG TPA: TAT-variant-translocated molybdopterin oxidoreductase [Verrucomicrobiae bacterium]|nr:TAT-variant-translocated molybdopterin oxidoreductase [Verrucomicrobiae bacterium]